MSRRSAVLRVPRRDVLVKAQTGRSGAPSAPSDSATKVGAASMELIHPKWVPQAWNGPKVHAVSMELIRIGCLKHGIEAAWVPQAPRSLGPPRAPSRLFHWPGKGKLQKGIQP